MKTKITYWILVSLLHGVILWLSWMLLGEEKYYILLVEVGLIVSLLLFFRLYRSFTRPIKLIDQGVSAIRDNDFAIKYVKTGSSSVDLLIETYNGVIDRIRDERKHLEEQHFFLEKLIDASPSGIIILDYDDYITHMNPGVMRIMGMRDKWIGKAIDSVDHPLLRIAANLGAGESRVVTIHGVQQFKCHMAHFIHRGFSRKFLLIEELSREFLENEKKAYGKVIRMMAHEVNNSIGAVNSILHSLQEIYSEEEIFSPEQTIEILEVARERNGRLNTFMKNFAEVIRIPPPKKESVDLNKVLEKVVSLMQPQAAERGVTLETRLVSQAVFVQMDVNQIEQVLVNVLKNSIEACEEEGAICVMSQAYPRAVKIADNGTGIAPEAQEKLFTPFFSTKTHGQGVGLTLVREILINHGIKFSLKTQSDGWTVFEMLW